jgi:hypothetical protein
MPALTAGVLDPACFSPALPEGPAFAPGCPLAYRTTHGGPFYLRPPSDAWRASTAKCCIRRINAPRQVGGVLTRPASSQHGRPALVGLRNFAADASAFVWRELSRQRAARCQGPFSGCGKPAAGLSAEMGNPQRQFRETPDGAWSPSLTLENPTRSLHNLLDHPHGQRHDILEHPGTGQPVGCLLSLTNADPLPEGPPVGCSRSSSCSSVSGSPLCRRAKTKDSRSASTTASIGCFQNSGV